MTEQEQLSELEKMQAQISERTHSIVELIASDGVTGRVDDDTIILVGTMDSLHRSWQEVTLAIAKLQGWTRAQELLEREVRV